MLQETMLLLSFIGLELKQRRLSSCCTDTMTKIPARITTTGHALVLKLRSSI